MKLGQLGVVALSGLVGLPLACSTSSVSEDDACVAGSEEVCDCEGEPGVRTCGGNGVWSSCDCSPANGTGGAAGTGGATTGGAATGGAATGGDGGGAATTGGAPSGGASTGGAEPVAGAAGTGALGGEGGLAGAGGSGPPPDVTPPTLVALTPAADAVNVARRVTVTATFSEALREASVTDATFALVCDALAVPATVALDATGLVATLEPAAPLDFFAQCTVTLSDGIEDLAGNALALGGGPYESPFTVGDCRWRSPSTLETSSAVAAAPALGVSPSGAALVLWQQAQGGVDAVLTRRYDPAADTWSALETVSAENGAAASVPRVSVNADGTAMAVWLQSNGTVVTVWGRRYVEGLGWEAAVELDPATTSGDASAPDVVVDPSGNALAVWRTAVTGGAMFRFNRYEVGTGWGTADVLSDSVRAGTFSLAGDASGNIEALFQTTPTMPTVSSRRYDAVTGWGNEQDVCEFTWCTTPVVAAGANVFTGVWSALLPGPVTTHPLRLRRSIDGAWEAAGTTIANEDSAAPALVVDALGNSTAVWASLGTNPVLRWARHETAWGTAQVLVTTDTGTPGTPVLAVDAAGRVTALWPQSGRIWADRYHAGLEWVGDVAIDDAAGDASAPAVAGDAAGDVTAVWVEPYATVASIWFSRCE